MNSRAFFALAIPLTALIATLAVIFVISRILLGVNSKEIAPPVALGIAMVILVVCSVLATRTDSSSGH